MSREEELRQQVAELQVALAKAQRQSDEWLAVVSHDLRGPLTLVLGYAENILRHKRPGAESSQDIREVEAIVAAARRLNKMFGQVVDGARIDASRLPLRIRPTDLAPLIQASVRAAKRAYPTRQFRLDLARRLSRVNVDQRALETIIRELLSNAAVFSPPDAPIQIIARRLDDWIQVSVVDTGLGFTPAELEHAFERRFRPERCRDVRREGLGVSLSIARSLAELLDGRLILESLGPNQGAIASLYLPSSHSDAQEAVDNSLD